MQDAEATLTNTPGLSAKAAHAVAESRPAAGAALAEGPEAARRRGLVRAALVTMRPRQWIKNLLVVAAPGAAGALGHDDVPVRVGLSFLAFCLLAGGIYAVNDVRDAEEDRLHPRKRRRPVAAGELAPTTAVSLGLALIATGIVLCAFVRPLVGVVAAAYVALTLSYTLVWRHLLLLDIVAIAGGFVLRAVAGGAAAPVALSLWFVLVITCGAVFVAAGKRQSELQRTRLRASSVPGVVVAQAVGRRVLEGYSEARLRLILALSGIVAVIAYGVWAFELPSVNGVPWRPLTIIPFAVCIARYGALIQAGKGEAPEDLLLGDRLLMLCGLAWLVLFALGVHAAG
jgi:decaprenyl-phosphate phosphoribosyltransferase